jgi:uncharacterized protein
VSAAVTEDPSDAADTWTVRYALTAYALVVAIGFALTRIISSRDLRVGAGVLLIDAVMVGCIVALYRRRPFTAAALGLRAGDTPRSLWGMVLGLIGVIAVNAVWMQGVLGHSLSSLGFTLHESAATEVLTGFALAVCAPVVEEVFFRGVLYRALRNRLNIATAAILAGALFAAIHATTFPIDTLPPRFAFGIIACLLYEYSGSLYPGIALHSLIDGGGFASSIGHPNLLWPLLLVLFAALAVISKDRQRPLPQS